MRIRNNTVVMGRTGARAALRVEDVARALVGGEAVSSDRNALWRPSSSSPRWWAVWARYPQSVALPRDAAELRRLTGQELHSTVLTGGPDPLTPGIRDGLPVPPPPPSAAGAARGEPLPPRVAGAVRTRAGTTPPVGLLPDVRLPS